MRTRTTAFAVPNPVSPKLHDPDIALQKRTNVQLHWMVLNIPGTVRELPEGIPADPKLPGGPVQLKTVGNMIGFRGPGAPAAGPHHHHTIELYALDAKVDLGPDATRADVVQAMDGHILGKAVLVPVER
jgi:Raf kinase inhibitor-like YbhB/YbcL family protein